MYGGRKRKRRGRDCAWVRSCPEFLFMRSFVLEAGGVEEYFGQGMYVCMCGRRESRGRGVCSIVFVGVLCERMKKFMLKCVCLVGL